MILIITSILSLPQAQAHSHWSNQTTFLVKAHHFHLFICLVKKFGLYYIYEPSVDATLLSEVDYESYEPLSTWYNRHYFHLNNHLTTVSSYKIHYAFTDHHGFLKTRNSITYLAKSFIKWRELFLQWNATPFKLRYIRSLITAD